MEAVLWRNAWQSLMLGVLMRLWGVSRSISAAGTSEAADAESKKVCQDI